MYILPGLRIIKDIQFWYFLSALYLWDSGTGTKLTELNAATNVGPELNSRGTGT
jgi:hypothetical protein